MRIGRCGDGMDGRIGGLFLHQDTVFGPIVGSIHVCFLVLGMHSAVEIDRKALVLGVGNIEQSHRSAFLRGVARDRDGFSVTHIGDFVVSVLLKSETPLLSLAVALVHHSHAAIDRLQEFPWLVLEFQTEDVWIVCRMEDETSIAFLVILQFERVCWPADDAVRLFLQKVAFHTILNLCHAPFVVEVVEDGEVPIAVPAHRRITRTDAQG